jgi:U3 small nucleolar ribonucleoprotein component
VSPPCHAINALHLAETDALPVGSELRDGDRGSKETTTMDSEIMRAKKGRRGKSKRRRKTPTGCKTIRRRMGKSGVRTIRVCPGKPARIVG